MFDFLFDPIGSLINLVPFWAWFALGFCAILFIVGVIWRFKDVLVLVHKIAGWSGVAAILGIIGTVIAVLWPKPKQKTTIEKKRPTFKLPTFRRKGKRQYNLDTNEWEDK